MLADSVLIPPMPRPPARSPSVLSGMLRARDDVLPLFPATAYRHQVMSFRLPGRLLLIVNHPEVVREVFVARHPIYQRKSRFLEKALAPVIGDSYFIAWGEPWAERRDKLAPPLHPSRVAGFHEALVTASEELAEDLPRAPAGRPVDMAAAFAAAIARVMLLAVFGPAAPREAAAEIAGAFTAYQLSAENTDILGMLGLPDWIADLQGRGARRRAREIRRRAATLLEAAGPRGGTPLLAALREARREDGAPLLQGEALLDEVVMLLLASAEGAANTLTWTAMLAALHPPSLRRVREELDRLPPGPPAASALSDLIFTRAVLQEAMRLYPPVAVLARQALAPDRIRRWEVKPGTILLAVPWLLHRHEALWDRPHAFLPERFLPGAPPRERFAYIPFGLGPRVCAGAAFGMAEMTVFAATLLRRFDFALAPGFAPMPGLRLALRPRGGMPMLAMPRGG